MIFVEINSSPIESKPLFEMERSFCKYLGIKTFGVHVNCYYRQGDEIFLWVGHLGSSLFKIIDEIKSPLSSL